MLYGVPLRWRSSVPPRVWWCYLRRDRLRNSLDILRSVRWTRVSGLGHSSFYTHDECSFMRLFVGRSRTGHSIRLWRWCSPRLHRAEFYSVTLVGFSRKAAVGGDLFSVKCFSLVFFKYIITNITLLICKTKTHHKACTLSAVYSSRSKPGSRMFRLNSQCNRRLTFSPKRVDLTNQKRPAVYTCANRDVFARILFIKETQFAIQSQVT